MAPFTGPDCGHNGQMSLRSRTAAAALCLGLTLVLGGCGGIAIEASSGPAPDAGPGEVTLPPVGARFDYQLGGASPVPEGVTVVARDSTEKPADGAYGICYVNGFQTQPGATWPEELLVRADDGTLLVDENWPDEHVLDLSTSDNRAAIAARMDETIAACAAAGYLAVEFDNLDSWTRSGDAFDAEAAADYATQLVLLAHRAGLAAAQKNTAELGARGRDGIGFDFAVTEECDLFDECGAFTDVYGPLVFDIEYTDDLRDSVAGVCERTALLVPRFSVIVRDRGLAPADAEGYEYAAC